MCPRPRRGLRTAPGPDLPDRADLAPSRVPILLGGETGAGKEVVAREIHTLSGRPGRFVAVNCAALPETLVESELFGCRKGAFSDAREDRAGLIRSADKGTLLLHEIGDIGRRRVLGG
jgi:transcriptional regulator with GAF, ATPase, and Fis domain